MVSHGVKADLSMGSSNETGVCNASVQTTQKLEKMG
jgi:hypothetical protein